MDLLVNYGIRSGSKNITDVPTITFVSKTDTTIVFTIRNNDTSNGVAYWQVGTSPPTANSFNIAAVTTSSNITVSGLTASTSYTIYAQIIANNETESEIVSITQTTLTPPWVYGTEFDHLLISNGTVGNYTPGSVQSRVYTYNKQLVRGEATGTAQAKFLSSSQRTPNHVVIMGGYELYDGSNRFDAYDKQLVRSNPTTLSFISSYNKAGHNEIYAFVGGSFTNNGGTNNNLNAFDINLTRSVVATNGSGGGTFIGVGTSFLNMKAGQNIVSSFNSTLTRTDLTNLPYNVDIPHFSSLLKDYGVGFSFSDSTQRILVYNKNLVRSDYSGNGITSDGGVNQSTNYYGDYAFIPTQGYTTNTATIINNSNLVKTLLSGDAVVESAVGVVGNNILVAGGATSGGTYGPKVNTVQRYEFVNGSFVKRSNVTSLPVSLANAKGSGI